MGVNILRADVKPTREYMHIDKKRGRWHEPSNNPKFTTQKAGRAGK